MHGRELQSIPWAFPWAWVTYNFKPSGIHLSIVRYSIQEIFPYHPSGGIARLTALGALFLFVGLCFSAVPAGAHSPSDMSLSYNETSEELVVSITHQVADPATHYIKEIQVSVDGHMVKNVPYTSQPTPTTFTYSYLLKAQAGSSMYVNAPCILGGSIGRTISIPGSAGSLPTSPGVPAPTTKAAAGFVPVLGLAFLPFWRRNR